MTQKINILIDNESVLDYVTSCNIKLDSGYCFTVDLQLFDKVKWGQYSPFDGFGNLRITVKIGDATYQFLLEERSTNVTQTGLTYSLWGRSAQALLGAPYAKVIRDTSETNHVWQSETITTAMDIIADAMTDSYTQYGYVPDFAWYAPNFSVYAESFSVSNQTPIDIIKKLADVGGYELYADIDGYIIIDTYKTDPFRGITVAEYNDFDDIITLNERVETPSGINAIVVTGYTPPDIKNNQVVSSDRTLTLERLDSGTIYAGFNHYIRLYLYPNETPSFYTDDDISLNEIYSGTKQIKETIFLSWGNGKTSYTPYDGMSTVLGDTSKPVGIYRDYTYQVYCRDYAVMALTTGKKRCAFYFEQYGNISEYNFDAYDVENPPAPEDIPDPDNQNPEPLIPDPDDPENTIPEPPKTPDVPVPQENPNTGDTVLYSACGARIIERNGNIPTVGGTWQIRYYQCASALDTCVGMDGLNGVYSNTSSNVSVLKTETITLTNGVGKVAYPINQFISATFSSGMSWTVKYKTGYNEIYVDAFVGQAKYYSVIVTIKYYAKYDVYQGNIPSDWLSTVFNVTVTSVDCDTPLTVDVLSQGSGVEIQKDGVKIGVANTINILTA